MKIIGFSGPPHSGKDSIADASACLINDRCGIPYPALKKSLAAPMRRVGMTLLGWDPHNDRDYARLKEESQPLLTPTFPPHRPHNLREFMILFSEDFIKPHYGQDFWARYLYTEVMALGMDDAVILIPDLGFPAEIEYFESVLGWENFITMQLVRAGCDFSKDSRDYVGGQQCYRFINDDTIEFAARRVIDAATHEFGWQL